MLGFSVRVFRIIWFLFIHLFRDVIGVLGFLIRWITCSFFFCSNWNKELQYEYLELGQGWGRYLKYSNRKWIRTRMSMVSIKLGLGCSCLGRLVGSTRFSAGVGALAGPAWTTAQTRPGTSSTSCSETWHCSQLAPPSVPSQAPYLVERLDCLP